MARIRTTDNNCGTPIDSTAVADLLPYSGVKIAEINSDLHPDVLIFPQCLGCKNGDEIEQSVIYRVVGKELHTTNIAGFLSIGNTQMAISSRFTQESDKDYFLHYLLQRVMGINIVDFKAQSDKENIYDLLPYLFPHLLLNALQQGIYKEYCTRNYNDSKVKGTVDIARHIKLNQPFRGNIAYRVREYAYDNRITQLIRYTIEHISRGMSKAVLHSNKEIEAAVKTIQQATPSYDGKSLQRVLGANMRSVGQPYFSHYIPLQRLCLMILRHSRVSFGTDAQQLKGILFDVAWLWEEHLALLLRPKGFKHPQNRSGKGGMDVFSSLTDAIPNKRFYPDFWKEGVILDAKYKRMEKEEGRYSIGAADLHQLISYLYITRSTCGGFVLPSTRQTALYDYGCLQGYGGNISLLSLRIPQSANTFDEFEKQMKVEEEKLKASLQNIA